MRVGREQGLAVLPGLEVCSREEVHLLAIFEAPEQALRPCRRPSTRGLPGTNQPRGVRAPDRGHRGRRGLGREPPPADRRLRARAGGRLRTAHSLGGLCLSRARGSAGKRPAAATGVHPAGAGDRRRGGFLARDAGAGAGAVARPPGGPCLLLGRPRRTTSGGPAPSAGSQADPGRAAAGAAGPGAAQHPDAACAELRCTSWTSRRTARPPGGAYHDRDRGVGAAGPADDPRVETTARDARAKARNLDDPFMTTRTTRRVGLGLSLLSAAARRCEGEVPSRPPRAGAPSHGHLPAQPHRPRPAGGHGRDARDALRGTPG